MVSKDDVRKWALFLAKESVGDDSSVSRVFWFPHDQEIRLVEVDESSLPNDQVLPFYFGPSPAGGVPLPSAIALIRPDEVPKRLKLPDDWGTWDDAEELVVTGR